MHTRGLPSLLSAMLLLLDAPVFAAEVLAPTGSEVCRLPECLKKLPLSNAYKHHLTVCRHVQHLKRKITHSHEQHDTALHVELSCSTIPAAVPLPIAAEVCMAVLRLCKLQPAWCMPAKGSENSQGSLILLVTLRYWCKCVSKSIV
jgi:hypothetical protein